MRGLGEKLVLSATLLAPNFAEAATPKPKDETVVYVNEVGGNDLLKQGACQGGGAVAPMVAKQAIDGFNQALLSAGTVTSQERNAYIRDKAQNYLWNKQKWISKKMEVINDLIDLYNTTPASSDTNGTFSQKVKPAHDSFFTRMAFSNQREVIEELRRLQDNLWEDIRTLDTVKIEAADRKVDDKAIFERDIAPALDDLNTTLGGHCTAESVGPEALYPKRDMMYWSEEARPLRSVAASGMIRSKPEDLLTLANQQILRFEEMVPQIQPAYAAFEQRYGLNPQK